MPNPIGGSHVTRLALVHDFFAAPDANRYALEIFETRHLALGQLHEGVQLSRKCGLVMRHVARPCKASIGSRQR
jgi:hypothetical protein